MELRAEITHLQNDAPAAAWFFARTILNAEPLIENRMPIDDKIRHFNKELQSEGTIVSGRVDGGMSAFGLRVLTAYLRALKRSENGLAYSATLRSIVKHGENFRELGPRDDKPPTDKMLQNILKKDGFKSLSEVIAKIEAEYRDAAEPDDPSESIQAIIAGSDIREEASSGRLLPHLERLEDIIGRL